jgi:hypothetical protein
VTVLALLATLVLIFAFQAENITTRWFHVLLIAVPILIQVYFNASLTYGLMRLFKVEYAVAAPGALIGASNCFELAVATAIALYGAGSVRLWRPWSECWSRSRLCSRFVACAWRPGLVCHAGAPVTAAGLASCSAVSGPAESKTVIRDKVRAPGWPPCSSAWDGSTPHWSD